MGMTIKRCTLLLIILSAVSSYTVMAFQDNQVVTARHVNVVQEKQARSIAQGERIGKLTPKEARKLREEQYEINALERKMRANGSLDTDELKELFSRLEKARNHINKLLRNNISTYGSLHAH